jgi:transcriptional regulator GlxA family with amidase domain
MRRSRQTAGMRRSVAPASPIRIALVVYPNVQGLDLSGPLEMFARATRVLRDEQRAHPGYSVEVVGTEAGPLAASSGFRFLPDTTFRALRGPVDTLLVVGGTGVDALLGDQAIVEWLRRMAGRVRRIGSVCTGAFLLAEAGLLDGRTATTHWSRAAELARRYPNVRVEEDRIWVRDGNLYSSAGVSAGIDLALALIAEDLGAEVALSVARAMVVYLRRPGDQSQYSAPLRLQAAQTPSVRELVAWATEHPASDLSVPALAKRAGKSPRHLTRIFRKELDVAPAEAVEQLRVEAARRALQQTDAGLEDVAARCGFGSAEVLRRTFLRTLHLTPSAYRARFSPGAEVAS